MSLQTSLADHSRFLQDTSAIASLLDQVRTIQCLAFQADVDYTFLHEHSDGVSMWPLPALCVCSLSSAAS